jgi:hypothetical protein
MREDGVSAWTIWSCPGCGRVLELHEEAPLEAWCSTCHRPLEGIGDEGDGLGDGE